VVMIGFTVSSLFPSPVTGFFLALRLSQRLISCDAAGPSLPAPSYNALHHDSLVRKFFLLPPIRGLEPSLGFYLPTMFQTLGIFFHTLIIEVQSFGATIADFTRTFTFFLSDHSVQVIDDAVFLFFTPSCPMFPCDFWTLFLEWAHRSPLTRTFSLVPSSSVVSFFPTCSPAVATAPPFHSPSPIFRDRQFSFPFFVVSPTESFSPIARRDPSVLPFSVGLAFFMVPVGRDFKTG